MAPRRQPLYDHDFEDGAVPHIDRFEYECAKAEIRSLETMEELYPSDGLRASESDDLEEADTPLPAEEPADPAPQGASDGES